MKNIHILPTDKPSRIYLIKSNNRLGITSNNSEFTENFGSGTQNQNIYITSNEEIEESQFLNKTDYYYVKNHYNEWYVGKFNGVSFDFINDNGNFHSNLFVCKKIILATDQDLIKDGVQKIDDEFLEWFVKNPSCESVEVINEPYEAGNMYQNDWFDYYKIIIPKEEPKQDIIMELEKDPLLKDFDNQVNKKISFLKQKQETLEEAAERIVRSSVGLHYFGNENSLENLAKEEYVIKGANWQQEQDKNKYSEEEIMDMFHNLSMHLPLHYEFLVKEQFKKK